MSQICLKCRTLNTGDEQFCRHCQEQLSSLNTKLLDNRYEVLFAIKSGAMGCVYKAKDIRLGNIVALKQMISNYKSPDETRHLEQSFKEEAALLSRLHHGGVPKVTDYFTVRDPVNKTTSYYISMTFIEGKDLDVIIAERNKRPFPIETALDYFYQILDILKYLHSQPTPIIYRDLKPSNLIVNDDKVFLVDFGIAQIADLHNAGVMTGTAGYMSPEQTQGFADERSDLYSLGVLMHYLVTGLDPQEGVPYTFESPRKINSAVPEALDAIITSLLDLVPANRPQSARKVMQLLDLSASKDDSSSTVVSEILDDNERKTFRDYQDIFEAIEKSNINAVREFVFMGTDVNARDRDHWTPLHRMIEIGNKEISELLISKDADINAVTHKGWTPLHVAAMCGQDEVAELLLIEGAEADRHDIDGWTPLHWAANQTHREMVKLLVTWGAKTKAQDNDKWTPLHWAVMKNNMEIVEKLISTGADPNNEFSDGSMPLHVAVASGNLDMVKYLISNGADVNAENRSHFRRTPLHSVDKGNMDLIDYLVEKGASIEKLDDLGRDPLYGLSEEDTAELLTRHGRHGRVVQNDEAVDLKRWIPLLRERITSVWKEICLKSEPKTGSAGSAPIELRSDDIRMRFGIESIQIAPPGPDHSELAICLYPARDCCYTNDRAVEGKIDENGLLQITKFQLPSEVYQLRLNEMLLQLYRDRDKKPDESLKKRKTSMEAPVRPGMMSPSNEPQRVAEKVSGTVSSAVKDIAASHPRPVKENTEPGLRTAPQPVKEVTDSGARPAPQPVKENTDSGARTAPQPARSSTVRAGEKKAVKSERMKARMFSPEISTTPPSLEEINDMCNAAAKNDVDRIKMLLKNKPELIDCKTDVGTSPLHWTASGGAADAMELLISEGADINSRDNLGLTPLHLARSQNVAELLISYGAGIDAKSDYERTPLHCAVGSGNTEVTEFLISKGADINAVNKKGETALDVAKKFRKNELINILYAHGAK
ncbi:MAG: ankyrin repeat domain-containing protein [Vulcanimicrobiota bacterium]